MSVVICAYSDRRWEQTHAAVKSALAGTSASLERERRHVAVVIPAALLRNLRQGVTGDKGALLTLVALAAGLASAGAGYLTGRASSG